MSDQINPTVKRKQGRPRLPDHIREERERVKQQKKEAREARRLAKINKPKGTPGRKRTKPPQDYVHVCEVCEHRYKPYNMTNHINSKFHQTAVKIYLSNNLAIPEMQKVFI